MDLTLPHGAYLDVLEAESARFVRAAAAAPPDVLVPSCPVWRAADLVWHLAEVQYFWSRIVAGQDAEGVPDLARPQDEYLQALFEEQTLALLAGLRQRDPTDACWSWSPVGASIGWVARRQAHEALIHRVALLVAEDTDAAWTLAFGRFTGTSPNTGRSYDEATVVVCDDPAAPEVSITGRAWDLDRWLWGRGDLVALQVAGNADLAGELRRIAEVE